LFCHRNKKDSVGPWVLLKARDCRHHENAIKEQKNVSDVPFH